jgi:alcohol dehydrogenase (cytochrome c)
MLAGNDKTYLYHNSTLALNADTGKIVWYYQHVVDHWDFDHPFERLLIDTAVAPDASQVAWISPKLKPGERRKVVTGIPGKTGLSIRSIARPANSSGPDQPSGRTWFRRSTARLAKSR